MNEYASESGHWYKVDGTPCYTVVGKNGKERPTTLRDARTLNLLPSVTGIIGLAAAPGLERWKRNQVLLAALTLTRAKDEPDDSFLSRVETDSREQGKTAAEKGEMIHGAIERYYRGDDCYERWAPWVGSAAAELESACGKRQWLAEKSYAYKGMYGCRIDLHSTEWLIDIKTKEGRDKVEIYDEHVMQLAANARATGLPITNHGILFVGRDEPWAEFVAVKPTEIRRGWDMFMGLWCYWQAKTQHFPTMQVVASSAVAGSKVS